MSLELIRETFKTNHIVGQGDTHTVIENDIIVPDSKPDISRILLLDGDVFVTGTEVLQDRITVNGSLAYKILYIPDDAEQPVKGINARSPFSVDLDIDNARQGMKSKVKCNIEHIDYEILNGRKVNIKTVLSLAGKIEDETAQDLVYDLEGIEDIQVLRNDFSANFYSGSSSVETAIRESLEIPSGKPTIREILRTDVRITGKDCKATDNRIIAKGELAISTLYVADDENRSLQVMEHGLPFTQFIDIVGATEDSTSQVDIRIAETSFEPEEDSDGELRHLSCDIGLSFYAEAYNKRKVEYIEDAYSPQLRIEIEKNMLKMQEYAAESTGQAIVRDTVQIDPENPDIAEVFNVIATPSISEYRILEDSIAIDGTVSSRVLYLANNSEQPVYVCEKELPFKHTVELKGIKPDMSCDIELDIEHCNYSIISSKEVELRLGVSVNSKLINQLEIPVIERAFESPQEDKRLLPGPSVTIYFSQPGDTLWGIAKKYYTTISDIQRINTISDQELAEPGQQIIIPRRVIEV